MAKQKAKEEFSFSDIGKIFDDISKSTSIIIEKDNNARDFISTGNYIFDASLSSNLLNGGIQTNRITALAGESGVGKSFLCYNIAREAQKKGYNVIYIDTEFSIERGQLSTFGIDNSLERFILIRSNKVEEIKVMLAKFLNKLKEEKVAGKQIAKTILFLDSAGQLASNKEVDDAVDGKDKTDMTRAKAMGSLFRIINADLGWLEIPMVVTNHTYQTMEMFSKTVMKGGTSLYYSASTITFLTKAPLKTGAEDDMDMRSGLVLTAKTEKNRLAKPKKVKFELDFTKGMNKYKGLEAFCRPEYFEKIGIAKGKYELDKSTGAMEFKPGGNFWYIRHLDKKVTEKNLFTSEIFNDEVMNALAPIVSDYFSYKSLDELEAEQKQFDQVIGGGDEDDDDAFGIDSSYISSGDLFD